ncbi:MAG: trigger factor [Porticoccaceae bacterium]|nr:trigger factor [Porticoccaceae bacterium]
MQVSIETTSGLERRLTVGVPAAEVEGAVSERIEKAARTIRLNGFRPGRVPVKVVRQRFGGAIRQEVIGETLSRTFQDAVSREGIRPAGPPRIDPVRDEPGEDLEYTAVFEVYPEVRLGDLGALEIVKPVASVVDADVDAMIERLRDQRASWEEVERPAAAGDRVRIDYRGTRGGEAVEGGSAEGAELVLGSGRMIPGFEDAVVGMSAGDSKTVTLAFPEDYQEESLRGVDVEFEIALESVQEKRLPEVDAEFLQAFGIEDGDMERFRSEVQRNMERELNTALRSKLKSRTLEQLLASHEVELPQALVAEEIKVVRRQMVAQFGGGASFDESMLPDDLFADQARRRVKLGLIVAEIVKSAEIRVDEARVRERLAEIAAGYEDPEQVMRYYLSNEEALNALQGTVMEDQVVDHLVAGARVVEEPLDYEAALKPDPAPAGEGD